MVQWRGRRQSGNIEDRRGMRPGGLAVGGGIGTVLVVLAISLLTGADPSEVAQVIRPGEGGGTGQAVPAGTVAPGDEEAEFVGAVVADTEDTWNQLMPQLGSDYQEPRLVLFREAVDSACGMASAAVGPFYCPLDQKFGAPGDFAGAYVVAHEVGHHVQNLLGITDQVHSQRTRMSQEDGNQLSVRLELQADCLAGVWGHHAETRRDFLDPGDAEEGLRAAAAVGDDRIQRRMQGQVVPESFTHGSAEQRMTWFRRGFESGDPRSCDTFAS